jgi:hypothetical protein
MFLMEKVGTLAQLEEGSQDPSIASCNIEFRVVETTINLDKAYIVMIVRVLVVRILASCVFFKGVIGVASSQ